MPALPLGATPDDWFTFDSILGLTEDILPVVCDTSAPISPASSLKTLGKVPSLYNARGEAVGMPGWTQRKTTEAEIDSWRAVPSLGICLQTRLVRALDVDVTDRGEAEDIETFIRREVAEDGLHLPKRFRSNSSKFLLAFKMPGRFAKRRVAVANGIVEFLADGQQFICAGSHTSGARYEWDMKNGQGLPVLDFPILPEETFERVWAGVVKRFGTQAPVGGSIRVRGETIACDDPVAALVENHPAFLGIGSDGQLFLECPFKGEHTGDSGVSETAYFPKGTQGHEEGHFVCMHAHCAGRTNTAFEAALGLYEQDFEELPPAGPHPAAEHKDKHERFTPIKASEYVKRPRPTWIIKNILPRAELAVIGGASGAGKSFLALDMSFAIARGLETWAGRKVEQGRVVYIAAEGAGGVRNRLEAYALDRGIELEGVPLDVIPAAPNFLTSEDPLAVARAILKSGPTSVIIIDTMAQVAVGGNENASEDMGRVLANCKGLHTATGALIVLIHHLGKDLTRGLRGWSGIKGALDASIEVLRDGENRSMRVEKLKDGEDGELWDFRLKQVELWSDDPENRQTAACVEITSGSYRGTTEPKSQKKKRNKITVNKEWLTRFQSVWSAYQNNSVGSVTKDSFLNGVREHIYANVIQNDNNTSCIKVKDLILMNKKMVQYFLHLTEAGVFHLDGDKIVSFDIDSYL